IEVTFDIDANGIVNVSAKDMGTGKQQQITITSSSGLDESEIKKMVRDAESHADEDKEKRKAVDLRNQLDGLIFQTERTIRENKEKIPIADVNAAEKAIETGKKALETEDSDRIQASIDEITQISHKIAEAMYKSATAEQHQTHEHDGGSDGGHQHNSSHGGPGGKTDDDVVDAEYEEVE
ncbi:MAG: Hsp70 family protein, partial [Candidatus Coatesbacteria bacterium]|nr:Hsp70 family protein [Candidatus Coatesbacteria bacterium]